MNADDKQYSPSKIRLYVVYAIAFALFSVAAGRLFYLTVLDKEFLQNQGEMRAVRTESIPATRGMILDRNGEPLAVSTPTWTVIANPRDLWGLAEDPENLSKPASERKTPEKEIARLAEAMGVGSALLKERFEINRNKGFMYLKRQVPPHEAEAILDAKVVGVTKIKSTSASTLQGR